MKGVIFTEFLEMLEGMMSQKDIEKIIEETDLPSGGAYTAVGSYDHGEMINLVVTLHKKTNIPLEDLQKAFGTYLFKKLAQRYPDFIQDDDTVFSFLEKLDGVIHKEVLKLYPDAEVPDFDHKYINDNTLELHYTSPRPFADVAEGLLLGCIAYFDEKITLRKNKNATAHDCIFSLKQG